MKNLLRLVCFPLFFLIIFSINPVHAQLGELFNTLKKSLGVESALSDSDIIEGLKEALKVGSDKAVQLVSITDGYYGNSDIKIPLPGAVQKAEKILRVAGMGPTLDSFTLSMNRAAEKAAPEAKSIFWDSIKQMSFTDARKILNGRENEATLYFKEKTFDRLADLFKPITHNAMSQVGATRSYQELHAKTKTLPFLDSFNLDLDQYVTGRALDGLFFMLAEEERKIRTDPVARVSDILKKVFGKSP